MQVRKTALAYCCRDGILALLFGMTICTPARSDASADTSWWVETKRTAVDIADNGNWDLYLSGYAHHSRTTYSDSRIRKLNEKAWGGGFGKTIRNDKGNDESLYVLLLRDSNSHPQWSAGYAYQWIHPLQGNVEVGAGFSALFLRRTDWFDGWPFPAVLPLASIGVQQAKLMATYVPKVSTRKGKGNVLLLFARFEFGE